MRDAPFRVDAMHAREPMAVVESLWRGAGMADDDLHRLSLTGAEPALPSSFAVGTAAQATVAAAALAASAVGAARNGLARTVSVDLRDAALECTGWFSLDGTVPAAWDPVAGLYRCRDGWVRLHTNFAHHRDATLAILGLPPGAGTPREAVAAALRGVDAIAFEDAAARAGIVGAALRDVAAWDAHPQSAAVDALPLVELTRIGDAPPVAWPELDRAALPLAGLRVLDLTRILAGPVAGRTLAAHGADVLLVNAPDLPNISAIADTSRGKRSALADLRDPTQRARFADVLGGAHVLLQSYRPGGLEALGFGPVAAAATRPGIVCASLSACGRTGPWAYRRGFDSLVQTATGFNASEAEAKGIDEPQAMPVQILDMASGFLLAFGIASALLCQHNEGGSWHVQVSLARTGRWLRDLGRVEGGFAAGKPTSDDLAARTVTAPSGFGALAALRHAARLSDAPSGALHPSVRPGTDPLAWW